MLLKTVLILSSVAVVYSQIKLNGKCETDLVVEQNFDFEQFQGVWQQLERILNRNANGSCSTVTFNLLPNNVSYAVTNKQVISHKQELENFTACRLTANDTSARFNISFQNSKVQSFYNILKTDYKNYALVYRCKQLTDNTKHVWAWKLGRTANLNSTHWETLNSTANAYDDLKNATWVPSNHSAEACRVNGSNFTTASAFLVLLSVLLKMY